MVTIFKICISVPSCIVLTCSAVCCVWPVVRAVPWKPCVLQATVLAPAVVQVYSRNSESSLGKYPDAAKILKGHLKPGITSIVIDSEVFLHPLVLLVSLKHEPSVPNKKAIVSIDVSMCSQVVAVDRATNQIKPFQELSRRAKKHAAGEEVKGELCVFPFDCLYLNGEVLLTKPLSERRKVGLAKLFPWPQKLLTNSDESAH
eukprot:scaffold174769_cov43-Prasinocladus_malaysianus.AAC.1